MNIWQLENGIRCAYKQIDHTKIAHFGIAFNLGTRDEKKGKEGLVHFWEHMVFKGTERRKTKAIVDSIEVLGGEINAYTTKEKIYFHISILAEHWRKALDILIDICFFSIFPEKELVLEKGVILEEMSMYEDIPEENIVDVFEERFFEGHKLATNILGTRESINNTTREDFVDFVMTNLLGEEIVVSAVAPIDLKKVAPTLNKKLSELRFTGKKLNRIKPILKKTFDLEEKKSTNQVHCMLGFEGFPLNHTERITLFMLVHYLGGNQMNSILNMELREKRGLVYTVEASYTTYSDTGLVSIYFGCDPVNLKKCLNLVKTQIKKLNNLEVGPRVLKRIQGQLIAQLAMAEENNQGLTQVIARSLLDLGYVQNLDQIIEKVKAVDSIKLKMVAKEIFDLNKMSILKYIPN